MENTGEHLTVSKELVETKNEAKGERILDLHSSDRCLSHNANVSLCASMYK